jgi:hypothetical protein
MATATATPHAGEIKFTYGVPETFALKFLEPRVYEGSYGTRGMFTACDEGFGERKIWVDYEDAANIVIELKRLGIRTGESLTITKVKHPRGGGHGFLVARATAQPAPQRVPPQPAAAIAAAQPPDWVTRDEASTEALLQRSVELARAHGPQVFQRGAIAMPAPEPLPAPTSPLAEALFAAVDAALECTVYAARRGMEVIFSADDIRALASTQFIQNAKGGR